MMVGDAIVCAMSGAVARHEPGGVPLDRVLGQGRARDTEAESGETGPPAGAGQRGGLVQ